MKRPFYVKTPRNCFGEHLTACQFSIRSVFEPKKDIEQAGFDQQKADQRCKEMNDQHEVEAMAGMI